MAETRIDWPDIGKGIAIALIVVNHAVRGIQTAHIAEQTANWELFSDLTYAFMVPVFFFMSGWFAARSHRQNRSSFDRLLTHLVYPYFLWSVLQAILMITTGVGNTVVHWSDLGIMLRDGHMQFWFLHQLIGVFLVDLCLRFLRTPTEVRVCLAFALNIATMFGFEFGWPPLREMIRHLIYFEIGCLLSGMKCPNLTLLQKNCVVFAGFSGLVALHFQGAGYGTSLRPFAAFFGIAGCLGLASLIPADRALIGRWLRTFGQYSLQIYVLHTIASAGTRVLMRRFGITDFWSHLLLGSFAGLAIPTAIAWLDEKYCGWGFRIPEPIFTGKQVKDVQTPQQFNET